MLSPMSRSSLVRLLMMAGVVGFLLECALLFGYTMDDAFISFRYARNLARGDGLVYNPGQPPVEGYSNFLWTMLFVPVISWGWNPELVSKGLGIACGLGVFAVTVVLSRVFSRDSRFQVLAPLFVATSPAIAMQAITGLETHLFGLFFLTGVWLTMKEWETQARFPLSSLAFLGCALTRPEGVLLFAVSLGAAVALQGGARGQGGPRGFPGGWFVLSMLLFGAAYGVYTVWRLSYFGSLIPNTFYAKTAGLEQVQQGWDYLRDFTSAHGGIFLFLIGFLALVFRWREPRARYLAFIALAYVAMVVYEGGDWMPLFRLFAPVLPILFLFLQEGVRGLHEASQGWLRSRQRGKGAELVTAVVLVAMFGFSLAPLPAKAREAMQRQELYEKAHRRYGRWLAAHTPPGEPVALSDIGQFGYFSDLPVIDLVGLTSPEIARTPGLLHEKRVDPRLVLTRRPAHVVLVCYQDRGEWTKKGFPAETALLASDDFRNMYVLETLVYYKKDYSYWLFSRKDLKELR